MYMRPLNPLTPRPLSPLSPAQTKMRNFKARKHERLAHLGLPSPHADTLTRVPARLRDRFAAPEAKVLNFEARKHEHLAHLGLTSPSARFYRNHKRPTPNRTPARLWPAPATLIPRRIPRWFASGPVRSYSESADGGVAIGWVAGGAEASRLSSTEVASVSRPKATPYGLW